MYNRVISYTCCVSAFIIFVSIVSTPFLFLDVLFKSVITKYLDVLLICVICFLHVLSIDLLEILQILN